MFYTSGHGFQPGGNRPRISAASAVEAGGFEGLTQIRQVHSVVIFFWQFGNGCDTLIWLSEDCLVRRSVLAEVTLRALFAFWAVLIDRGGRLETVVND